MSASNTGTVSFATQWWGHSLGRHRQEQYHLTLRRVARRSAPSAWWPTRPRTSVLEPWSTTTITKLGGFYRNLVRTGGIYPFWIFKIRWNSVKSRLKFVKIKNSVFGTGHFCNGTEFLKAASSCHRAFAPYLTSTVRYRLFVHGRIRDRPSNTSTAWILRFPEQSESECNKQPWRMMH
jgi:hypothetical protein